jgi:NADH pyrophosphatase NudC (nudix superfamily)
LAPRGNTDIFVGDDVELAEVRWASLEEAIELLPGLYEPVQKYLTKVLSE